MSHKWFKPNSDRSLSKLRIYCFHYAGGGASIYRTWDRYLPDTVEVCAVQLPGREARICDTPYRNMNALVDDLMDGVFSSQEKPFVLFGHSMGAQIAYELAHRIEKTADHQLASLMVSGRRAPHIPNEEPHIHNLPENEFIAKILELGGTPEEVLKTPELLDLILPLLRADFELLETHDEPRESKLNSPIHAFGGTVDSKVPWQTIEGWGEHTHSDFMARSYDGGHFFIHAHQEKLVQDVRSIIMKSDCFK